MSFPDAQSLKLRRLIPPEFSRECSLCRKEKRLLPWQVCNNNGSWGSICDDCSRPFLIRLLRARLPQAFSVAELASVFSELGLCKLECEFLTADLIKDGVIVNVKGLLRLDVIDGRSVVVPLQVPRKKKQYRPMSGEAIFLRCVYLAREVSERSAGV